MYVPEQPRALKKRGDAARKGDNGRLLSQLEYVADAISPLNELIEKYGDRLRVAVDSETCMVALSGSHTRVRKMTQLPSYILTSWLGQPSKLSDMVYATLQMIARERDTGLSVLELGKRSGYDQKTCFYLVKQLIDLNLV